MTTSPFLQNLQQHFPHHSWLRSKLQSPSSWNGFTSYEPFGFLCFNLKLHSVVTMFMSIFAKIALHSCPARNKLWIEYCCPVPSSLQLQHGDLQGTQLWRPLNF
jgi:hypothetical protein